MNRYTKAPPEITVKKYLYFALTRLIYIIATYNEVYTKVMIKVFREKLLTLREII